MTADHQPGERYDLVVIGAGPAGTAAAIRAAELGARVAVVEASRTGGTCVNTGCVPTRVLAKTARIVREVRIAREWGIATGAPQVQWDATVARVHATVEKLRSLKDEAGRFTASGVELILEGRARFVDANTLVLDSGRRLAADSVIIAVGGHSRRLPVPGAELAIVPEHVLDLPSLPHRVAIIGAGNTGAQLVTVFSAFGSEVTLLDVAPRILAASDAAVSAAVSDAFLEQGVTVHTGLDGVESLAEATDGSISTFEASCRTSTRSATPTAGTCSCRQRTSRAKQRPKTPCSTRTDALRIICSRRAASPIPTTRVWD